MKRTLSCLVAAVIQLTPLARVISPVVGTMASPVAVVLRWVLGSVAVAGSFHGVSAASSITPASARATNGVLFTQRFLVNDDTSILYGNARSYTAVDLPPGLSIIQTGASRGIVTGTPTQSGIFHPTIIGWSSTTPGFGIEHFQSPHQVTITVVAGGGGVPTISSGPQSIAVHESESFSLGVTAQGVGPFRYQWMINHNLLPAATNSILALTNPGRTDSGEYSVRVSNATGFVDSLPAIVLVGAPLRIASLGIDANRGFGVQFLTLTNRLYAIQMTDALSSVWSTTGSVVAGQGSTNTVWVPLPSAPQQFYRVITAN